MLYPAILVVVSLSSVFLLLAFVVPQFETIFKDRARRCDAPAIVICFRIGPLAQDYGWLGWALGISGAVIGAACGHSRPRLAWDGRAALPLFGPVAGGLATARFCRTMFDPWRQRRRPAHGHRPVARRD